MSFATMTAKLKLNMTDFASNMGKASSQMSSFSKSMRGKVYSGWEAPAKKAGMQFKDVGRIVQGILISRVFYDSIQGIRAAKDAVWSLAKELEYAEIAYSNLFRDGDLAKEFIEVLKDFAARTPFDFTDSQDAARRLLAYGMQSKNVMYVMQGLMSASAMSGSPETVERLSRALGQVYTKGRLMNEEMRQLAEAGIPAYEILREELGLTQKQLQNLGRESIPAHTAINALVDGINKRFGGVADNASKTITGLLSNIRDNATLLGHGIFEPLVMRLKGTFEKVGAFLFRMRELFQQGGIGALFEALVPKELQGTLRQLIAGFMTLGRALKELFAAGVQLLGPVFTALTNVLSVLLPVITAVVNVLAGAVQWITSNSKVVQILSAVLIACASAWLMFRAAAIATAVIGGLIKIIGGVISALSFLATMLATHPILTFLILLSAGLLGASAASGKASKGIADFFGGLNKAGGVNADDILLPDSKDRAADLEKFNQALDGTGAGMDDLADSTGKAAKAGKSLLSFDEVFKLADPDEKGGGGGSDFDMGGIGGAIDLDNFMPEEIDFSSFATEFVENMGSAIWDAFGNILLGAGIGGLIGALFGQPLLGALIGGLLGHLYSIFDEMDEVWEKLEAPESLRKGFSFENIFGAAGNPFNLANIVKSVDELTSLLWSKLELPSSTKPVSLETVIGSVGNPFGLVELSNSAFGIWDGLFEMMGVSAEDFFGMVWERITTWLGDVWSEIATWAGGILADIGNFFSGIWSSVTGWLSNIWLKISYWFTGLVGNVSSWFAGIWLKISSWFTGIFSDVGKWLGDIWGKISGWFTGIIGNIGSWFAQIWLKISGWFSGIFGDLGNWLGGIWGSISTWFSNLISNVGSWFAGLWKGISDWFSGLWTDIKTWISDIGRSINTWWDNLWKNKKADVKVSNTTSYSPGSSLKIGHAMGGIFNKEHIARFAEGNKTEAIIPLENKTAMRPFVDAVSQGIMQAIAPLMYATAGAGSASNLPPMMVGTLIADERGLRELYKKFELIKEQEDARRGIR